MNGSALFAFAAAFLAAASAAQAAVVISNGKTRHMSCASGVCASTAKKATLNATDLANMLASADVKVATGDGAVSITVMDSFSWTSTHRLSLDAQENVSFHAPVSVAGTGAVTIATGDGIAGGTLVFFPGGSVDFWDTSSSLVVNGTSFTLVNDIATLANGIAANPSGAYALAKNYDASVDGAYHQAAIGTVFAGTFEGLGHAIENFQPFALNDNAALFSEIGPGGMVRDIGLVNLSASGAHFYASGIAYQIDAGGVLAGASVTGFVQSGSGLVALNSGTIVDSTTDVTVTNGSAFAARSDGMILRCHASGSISEQYAGEVGGLVGLLVGTIQRLLGKRAHRRLRQRRVLHGFFCGRPGGSFLRHDLGLVRDGERDGAGRVSTRRPLRPAFRRGRRVGRLAKDGRHDLGFLCHGRGELLDHSAPQAEPHRRSRRADGRARAALLFRRLGHGDVGPTRRRCGTGAIERHGGRLLGPRHERRETACAGRGVAA